MRRAVTPSPGSAVLSATQVLTGALAGSVAVAFFDGHARLRPAAPGYGRPSAATRVPRPGSYTTPGLSTMNTAFSLFSRPTRSKQSL